MPQNFKQEQKVIQEFGAIITHVPADAYLPGYSFTTGLYQNFNHPEIVCFGLKQDTLHNMLNLVLEYIKEGESFELDRSYKNKILMNDCEVAFIPVAPAFYRAYFGSSLGYYSAMNLTLNFPSMQLVWCDQNGKLPWDDGYDEALHRTQKLLDRDVDFFFYESRQLGVFVTPEVIEGCSFTKFVIHDRDGDWLFADKKDFKAEDLKLVSLDALVKLDPTLNSLFSLGFNEEAERVAQDQKWQKRSF